MMDLQAMRYVVTLAEELHFGRAARRHFIAEQAFGRRVARLERALGQQLFGRTSRRVWLTRTGERFVARARDVLADVDALAAAATAPDSGDGSAIRVGVLGFGMADRWPTLHALFTAQAPGIELRHVELDLWSQYEAVRSGEVDVGVVHDVGPVDGLELERVASTPRVAVVPQRSDFADASRLAESDVAGQPWVKLLCRHTGTAAWAGPAAESGRGSPVVRRPEAISSAVATSGMLGVHGAAAARYYPRPDVRFVPLEGPACHIAIATRDADRRGVVEAFRNAARLCQATT